MNFIKDDESGPKLQWANFEIFELRKSGLRWILVWGAKD